MAVLSKIAYQGYQVLMLSFHFFDFSIVLITNWILPAFRLVNGTSSSGRVEIFYKNRWGTICDDYFNQMAGHMICKAMGFRYVCKTLHENIKISFHNECHLQCCIYWKDNHSVIAFSSNQAMPLNLPQVHDTGVALALSGLTIFDAAPQTRAWLVVPLGHGVITTVAMQRIWGSCVAGTEDTAIRRREQCLQNHVKYD